MAGTVCGPQASKLLPSWIGLLLSQAPLYFVFANFQINRDWRTLQLIQGVQYQNCALPRV